MDDEENETFRKFMEDVLTYKQKEYQTKIIDDIIYGRYKTNTKDYFAFDNIVTLLHKTLWITIQYHDKDKKYFCEYIPLGITVTIPASMLGTHIMYDNYYGMGMSKSTHVHNLDQICSRIVFAIKNFGPTLNAIYDRIEKESKKKLDIPWTICYIREETNMIESPDWEIMEHG